MLVVSVVLMRLNYGSATLAGLPNTLRYSIDCSLCCMPPRDWYTPHGSMIMWIHRDLHWLRVPQRMAYRRAVLAFRCQYGTAPPFLSAELRPVADNDSRRRLRSANTAALVIPRTKHSTIGDHAFLVAAARVWNSLPPLVSSSPSLSVFQRRLKTELFTRSRLMLYRCLELVASNLCSSLFLSRDLEVPRNKTFR